MTYIVSSGTLNPSIPYHACAFVMQVLQLKVTIGNLVMTMIEENSVESLVVAKVCHLSVTHSARKMMNI